jgi:nucleotide-binding universal stress UspA family protein
MLDWYILRIMKRVLMPVDFSPRDAAAAHYVKQLAGRLQLQTILMHVVPPPDYEAAVLEAGGPVLQELMETRRKLAMDRLASTCLKELGGVVVERVLLEGFPSERIVEYAKEREVDWILLPTHGYGPFRRFLLGSVTTKVLHDADCAVLTGAHMETPKLEDIHFRKIAAAIDLSDSSSKVIAEAKALADQLGAKLVVMHAMQGLSGHVGFNFEKASDLHFESAVKERVAEFTKGMDVEVLIETGDPGKTIAALVKSSHTDLVVIARSTSHGLAAMRSYTYAIVRESGVPVLSV